MISGQRECKLPTLLMSSYLPVSVVLVICSYLVLLIIKPGRNASTKPLTIAEFIMQTPRDVPFCVPPSYCPLLCFSSFPNLKKNSLVNAYWSLESGLSSHQCWVYKHHFRKERVRKCSWCLCNCWFSTKQDRILHPSSSNFKPSWGEGCCLESLGQDAESGFRCSE